MHNIMFKLWSFLWACMNQEFACSRLHNKVQMTIRESTLTKVNSFFKMESILKFLLLLLLTIFNEMMKFLTSMNLDETCKT